MTKKRIPIDEVGYRKPRKMSEDELTIRLIESIHATALVLKERDLSAPKVVDAVIDLFENSGGISALLSARVQVFKDSGQKIKL